MVWGDVESLSTIYEEEELILGRLMGEKASEKDDNVLGANGIELLAVEDVISGLAPS